MRLRARLEKLARNLPPPAIDPRECPLWYIGALVLDDAPLPPEDEIPRCRTCGGVHVLHEILTIVGPAGEGVDS
jgi:hypothetical protein